MKVLKHLVKKYDFIGPEIKFRINKEENYKTYLGGSLSLIAYLLYVGFFFVFGLDLFYRRKPIVLMNQLTSDEPQSFTITNDTFIAFRIDDFRGNEFDFPSLFSVSISLDQYDNEKDTTIDNSVLGYKRCSDAKYLKFFETDTIFDPEDWYCFDTAKVAGRNITGTPDTDSYSYLLFQMDICDLKNPNLAYKVNCKDYKAVRDSISKNKLYLNILYNEVVFTPSIFENPFRTVIKKYRNNLNLNLNKQDVFYFMNHQLKQDSSMILPEEKELMSLYGVDRIEKYVNFRTNDELNSIYANSINSNSFNLSNISSNNSNSNSPLVENMYSIYFEYEPEYKLYSRDYLKIPDVLANVQGFMDLLLFVVGFVNLYTRTQLAHSFFNHCVKVKFDDFAGGSSKANRIGSIEMGEAPSSAKGFNKDNNDDINNYDLNINNNNSHLALDLKENLKASDVNENQISENERDHNNPSSNTIKKENSNEIHSAKNKDNNTEFDKGNNVFISGIRSLKVSNPKKALSNKLDENEKNNEDNQYGKEFNNYSSIAEKKDINLRVQNLTAKKKDSLQVNFFDFYIRYLCLSCKNRKYMSKNNKKNYDTVLLRNYLEKIERKVDIFHYLKALGRMKGLKDFLIKNEDEKICFDALTENLYTVKINNEFDCKVIGKGERSKHLRIKSYLSLPENKVNGFIVEKFNEII